VLSMALGIAALLAGPGCSKPSEAEKPGAATRPTAAAPVETNVAAPRPAAPHGPSDLAYDAPATWQKAENPSPMRKATFKIPHAPGDTEDAELSVTQAGGTVDMNVTRWSGQFDHATATVKRSEKNVGTLKVTMVEIRGKYNGSGMPGAPAAGPKDNYALLGAIIETTPPTFFKMTGPEKTVTGAKADFDKFIDSVRAK
jgi:hypothetical protein